MDNIALELKSALFWPQKSGFWPQKSEFWPHNPCSAIEPIFLSMGVRSFWRCGLDKNNNIWRIFLHYYSFQYIVTSVFFRGPSDWCHYQFLYCDRHQKDLLTCLIFHFEPPGLRLFPLWGSLCSWLTSSLQAIYMDPCSRVNLWINAPGLLA